MPTFSFGGGELLSNIEVVAVFARVNPAFWLDFNGAPVREVCRITNFLSDMVDSAYMDLIAREYSVANGPSIGRGKYLGTFILDIPTAQPATPPDFEVSDADIQKMLDVGIQGGTLPRGGRDICYFVFVADSSVVWRNKRLGTAFGGYHSLFTLSDGTVVTYCVIDASGRSGDSVAYYTSHELVEVVTDPDTFGWNDKSTGKEVADVCERIGPVSFHGYSVSSFWSRKTDACRFPPEDNQKKPEPSISITGAGYCDGGAVEGVMTTFKARALRDGRPDPIFSYLWNVEGAQVVGAINQDGVSVVPPSPPAPFQVAVLASDTLGCSLFKQITVQTVTSQQSAWQQRFCGTINLVRGAVLFNFHIDPLWDPLRDFVVRPVSAREIRQLRQLTDLLIQLNEVLATMPGNRKENDREQY